MAKFTKASLKDFINYRMSVLSIWAQDQGFVGAFDPENGNAQVWDAGVEIQVTYGQWDLYNAILEALYDGRIVENGRFSRSAFLLWVATRKSKLRTDFADGNDVYMHTAEGVRYELDHLNDLFDV